MYSLIDVYDLLTSKKYEFKAWTDVSCHAHCHYIFEAVIVRAGTFAIEKGGTAYLLHENEMMFIMPFETHKFDTVDTSEILVIQISPHVIPYFEEKLKNRTPKEPVCSISPEEIRLLYSHINRVESNVFVELNFIFFHLLSILSQNNSFIEYIVPDDTFRKMLMYVSTHFEENICLKDVARELGVSYVYLSRLYSKNIPVRFNDFINSFRIQKSRDMLLEGTCTVSEISSLCGFGSIRNFNRVFFESENCTPKEFRQRGRKFFEH